MTAAGLGNLRNTADITRFIALEGRVWSLAANGLLSLDDIPVDFPVRDDLEAAGVTDYCHARSCVAAPDGTWLVEPVPDEERLVVADVDLAMVARERQAFDPTGHYSRPDISRVEVNRQRRTAVHFHN